MSRRMKIGLAALVLALGGWFYASPYIAFHRMQAAAVRRDAVALADYVNFPALRESLKASLTAQMTKHMAPSSDNPFAGLGLLLAHSLIDRMVDGLVTPEGLAAMMQGASPEATEKTFPSDTEPTASGPNEKPIIKMGYEKFDRFTVRFVSPNNPSEEFVLVLLRERISWKLSAVRFPPM